MPRLLEVPKRIDAAGSPAKSILEFVGRVATGHKHISVAQMVSPGGWHEAGQRPEFDEITVVLRGMLRVEHEAGQTDVRGGQAIIAVRGEWVRYSTPEPEGAEYIAICLPAFSQEAAHRDGKPGAN
jgi:mannose-6-phosphate isomerase-like protein (cupin superfamily)